LLGIAGTLRSEVLFSLRLRAKCRPRNCQDFQCWVILPGKELKYSNAMGFNPGGRAG
jgi:hypothetical protein